MLCKGWLIFFKTGNVLKKNNKMFLCKKGNSSITNCWPTLWRNNYVLIIRPLHQYFKRKGQIFMYYGMNQVEGPSAHKAAGEPTGNEADRGAPPTQEGREPTRNKPCRGAIPTKKAVSPGGCAVVPLDGQLVLPGHVSKCN
jgi:hypothetical protein